MKRTLLLLLVFLLGAPTLKAAPVLFETNQTSPLTILPDESDTLDVAEILLSVDSSSYVILTAGAMVQMSKMWFEVDGDSISPVARVSDSQFDKWSGLSFTYHLSSGDHTITLKFANHENYDFASICTDAYLQALIFLPDEASAITEAPTTEPGVVTPSVISSGPYVNVAGASELVDSSGRVIENAIAENRVYINNLPMGTYFARDGEQTVVKIVKVQ